MTISDFKKAFENYDIVYYHDDWKQSSYSLIGTG
jgi:hypothetical protein